jgi:hypothetical protein
MAKGLFDNLIGAHQECFCDRACQRHWRGCRKRPRSTASSSPDRLSAAFYPTSGTIPRGKRQRPSQMQFLNYSKARPHNLLLTVTATAVGYPIEIAMSGSTTPRSSKH